MNHRGPCSDCGAPLTTDQRYCINCGNRVAPPLALPYLATTPGEAAAAGSSSWALPLPIQAATTFAALALGFGVVVGTAISPNLSDIVAAPQQVVQAPPPAGPEPPPAPAPSGPSPAPSGDTIASTGTTVAPSGGGGGGGGGGGKKKKKKAKQTFLNGTVVHTNPVAGSYALASGGGLLAVHAGTLPTPGTIVRVPIRSLDNRTNAEAGKRQLKGQAAGATFAGIVTGNLDSSDSSVPDTYTVSARGASVLVHSPPDPGDTATPPAIGALVTTTVEIKNAVPTPKPPSGPPSTTCTSPATPFPSPPVVPAKELFETAKVVDSTASITATEIETVIQAVCAPGEVVVSSDDIREGNADVVLHPRAAIDLARLSPGQAVIASVTIVSDGGGKKLDELTGVASDQGTAGANDPTTGQGDLARVAKVSRRQISRAERRAANRRRAKK